MFQITGFFWRLLAYALKIGFLGKKNRSMYVSTVAVTHCTHGNGVSTFKAILMGNVGKNPMGMVKMKGTV